MFTHSRQVSETKRLLVRLEDARQRLEAAPDGEVAAALRRVEQLEDRLADAERR